MVDEGADDGSTVLSFFNAVGDGVTLGANVGMTMGVGEDVDE